MHDPAPMPALASGTAAFLQTDAAGLPSVRSAWLYTSGPSVSLTIASEGTAAYRDLTEWADAFGVGPDVRPAAGNDNTLYASVKFKKNGVTYDVTAIINTTSLTPSVDHGGDGEEPGTAGNQKAA